LLPVHNCIPSTVPPSRVVVHRWEESCTVKKSMAAVKALEDPSAALRQKLVNAWELQLRERSLRKLCERSSVATSQRNGGALPRTARRGRRKSNASIAAAAVAKLFDTTSSMDQECDSSGEVVAEETITLKPSPGLTSLLGQLDQHAKHVDADAVLFATQVRFLPLAVMPCKAAAEVMLLLSFIADWECDVQLGNQCI